MSPSSTSSFTPVTATGCATLQLPLVKTSGVAETVPSVTSLDATEIDTSAVGSESSTMVKVSSPVPASVVIRPAVCDTVTPAVSLSTLVTLTSSGSTLSYVPSVDVEAAVTMV